MEIMTLLKTVKICSLPSAFHERVQQIEETRNQRISHLQEEKELQTKKSLLLAAKLSNIRSMEQRCLFLEHKNSALSFKILSYKSEIERLEVEYKGSAQQFRDLKSELYELEENEKEKDKFYGMKTSEMKEFKQRVENRVFEARKEIEEMRKNVLQVKATLQEALENNKCSSNLEIDSAEKQKAELLVMKESLERTLASNYQLRTQLEKQLYRILIMQDEERKKVISNS